MFEQKSDEITTSLVVCSKCFKDHGIKLMVMKMGTLTNMPCPNCNELGGEQLSKEQLDELAYEYFVCGSVVRTEYGIAPLIQYNIYHYKENVLNTSERLATDIKLIGEKIKKGFFHYGPPLWMLGENEELKSLQHFKERRNVLERILKKYPLYTLKKDESFYRLRVNPKNPSDINEYDSPPLQVNQKGRFDSNEVLIMYGSMDLEACVHECRVTIEDELYFATLMPKRELKLLDLTVVIECQETHFESLEFAVDRLFQAGKYSYKISRELAKMVLQNGFDGILYPSYYRFLTRNRELPKLCLNSRNHFNIKGIPNIALFGRPIEQGLIAVDCINRLLIKDVKYDIQFGPACTLI